MRHVTKVRAPFVTWHIPLTVLQSSSGIQTAVINGRLLHDL